MKTKKILSALMLILMALFVMQCEKQNGRPDGVGPPDEGSDHKPWAGPDGEENPHTNSSPGITKGGNYGDLLVLLRSPDGVPEMTQIEVEEGLIWVVQPVDIYGETIDYNSEGELDDPTAAIPVDFGRLNIVRSPDAILEQAFIEAMKVMNPDIEDFPTREVLAITLDFCGRLTSHYTDDDSETIISKTIDSPRENMAIYREIMQNQTFDHVFPARLSFLAGVGDPLQIAASCFAAGSDKTGTVDVDEMVYINTFMECAGSDPIENDNEYGPDEELREYFDFSSYDFSYDRFTLFNNRHIQCLIDENGVLCPVDEDGHSDGPIYTIWDIFMENETPVVGGGSFSERWDIDNAEAAELFTIAIDDAVQVLDYVHGNSNFRFVDALGNPL